MSEHDESTCHSCEVGNLEAEIIVLKERLEAAEKRAEKAEAQVKELRDALIGLIGVADRTPCWCMNGHADKDPHKEHCDKARAALRGEEGRK